ncbi:MAG: Uma2 family endonuclease [Pirellulales bacterium]
MATGHDANITPNAGDFATAPAMTAETFFSYPNEGRRLELVAGEIREMSPCGFDHGALMIHLGSLLMDFARKDCAVRLASGDVGFVIARNPDTVLAPDIAVVRSDRIPATGCPRFVEGAPDLAVEIVSPSDRASDVEAKARHWIGCGARVVWVVHGAKKTVTVYLAGGKRSTLVSNETLDGGDVLPGFACDVRRIFEV